MDYGRGGYYGPSGAAEAMVVGREFLAMPIRDVNSLYPCSLLEEIAMLIVSCGCILSGIGIFVGVRPFLERIGLV